MANISLDLVRGDLSGPTLMEMLIRWHKKYQVLDGYAISAQGTPNNTVAIDAGNSLYDGIPTRRAAAGNITFATCSETQYRIDLLYAKNDGTVGIHQGDNAAKLDQQGLDNWRQYIEPYVKASCPAGAILGCVLVKPRAGGSPVIESGDIWSWGPQSAYGVVPYMYSVSINIRGTVIYATDSYGQIISSGVVGTDDTDVFDDAVAGCPTNGSIFIGPGVYTLLANKLFYLSGDGTTNPMYYCIGILEAKNVHIFGAGPGITTLKLANSQHYTNHMAVMILNRTTGDSNNGHTGFTVANLTLDGNKANQSVIYNDGSGCILTGSIRSNEFYWNLEIKNSFGYSIYVGNNGNGPANYVRMNDLYIHGSYKSGITTDTATDLAISNCVIEDSSSGMEILGNTDYATRSRDNIAISNVTCRKAGITIWCINGLVMTGCIMDIAGATSYGFQIHCSYNIDIIGSSFAANKTSQYVSYIDGGQYVADGAYKNVNIHNCTFDGYIALKVFGSAKIQAYNCIFHAYTDGTNYGACVHLKEMEETVTCEVKLYDCELIAEAATTKLVETVANTALYMYRCHAPNIGTISVAGGVYWQECYGPGLERYSSRWRLESPNAYNTTPASGQTITMTVDRTGDVGIGTPVKLNCATSGTTYGIITSITSNLITIAGPPMSGTIYGLFYGPVDLVGQIDYIIPGAYADGANSALISTDQKSYSFWRGRPARLVQIGHRHHSNDSTSNPYVTVLINGNAVGTDNSNAGLQVTTSVSNTTSGINASNNRILNGQSIEIKTSAGGTGNANTLTTFLTFVSED